MDFKKLSEVEVVAEPIESANVLIEEDGVIKRVAKNEVGGIKISSTASVGQTIVVKAVDENGNPTEWEAADMADADEINITIELREDYETGDIITKTATIDTDSWDKYASLFYYDEEFCKDLNIDAARKAKYNIWARMTENNEGEGGYYKIYPTSLMVGRIVEDGSEAYERISFTFNIITPFMGTKYDVQVTFNDSSMGTGTVTCTKIS